MRKRVLVIGASGKIAGQVLPALRARYALTLLDVRAEDRSGRSVEGVEIADLGNADRDAYRAHFSGIDAVVHFGFVRPENDGAEARFRAEMRNVEMAYNVYMTALRRRGQSRCRGKFKPRRRLLRRADSGRCHGFCATGRSRPFR